MIIMEKPSRSSFVGCVLVLMFIILPGTNAAPDRRASSKPEIIDSTHEDPAKYAAVGWHTEKPPYPFAARASHEQGQMHVVIITGADGRVVKAAVFSDQPHPILDVSTAKWAYTKWYGPPNHRAKIPVRYVLHY